MISASNLLSGRSKKCNICKDGIPNGRLKFHGGKGSRLYRIWRNIISRCENPNASEYNNYGGRGIQICEEWRDFHCFREWSMTNGYRDDLSIDRIDNDGNYTPLNCRWATREEQQANRRTSKIIEYKGRRQTLKEWTNELGIPYSRTQMRIKVLGWSINDAFEKEKNYRHRGGDNYELC